MVILWGQIKAFTCFRMVAFCFQHYIVVHVCLAISPLLANDECLLLSFQFTCSREKLKDCVADELNTSSVTLCLLHNLTKTAEDGLTLCSSQTLPCHFPEVSPIIFSMRVLVQLACVCAFFC